MFEFEKISKVYIGADHCCRCGCKGNYYYTSHSKENDWNCVNDKRVKALLTRAQHLFNSGKGEMEEEANYTNISYGNNRAITIYYL